MTKLFSPITFNRVTLKNRIVMSPMCMYSSHHEDGQVNSFHLTHYTSRAVGQVGLIMIEATAILPEGRISPQDLGIWHDDHIQGLKRLTQNIHEYGAKAAIQLAHAGRKGQHHHSVFAPSALAFNNTYKKPIAMSVDDIQQTLMAFKNGAKRAKQANFDIVEIHGAHGYLINQFLSPLTNKRTDKYGGGRDNRYRFLQEVIEAVQSEWDGPLFVRLSTDEYHEQGNTLDDMYFYAEKMKEQGIDLIDCSSGGVAPTSISTYPGYQLKQCEAIKHKVSIPTGAVGLITSGLQAEEIIQNDRADLIFIGRALLRNPYWAKAAAEELNENIQVPKPYERGWMT